MAPSPPPVLPALMTALLLLAWIGGAAAADPQFVGGRGRPVLLVAGPEADPGLYRWEDGGGLAPYLVRRGFAVWLADGEELARAVDAVRERSGAERVALVGHGLGGTACYRYLAESGDGVVAALVTLGAPAGWTDRSPLLDEVLAGLSDPDVARYSSMAGRPSATTGEDLFASAFTALPADRLPALTERAREAGAVSRRAALDDLESWADLAEALPAGEAPALLLCGELDRIAPCEEAWRARDARGPSARVHKLGYMNLDGHDFGHLDLALTAEARRRVFPRVARFLRSEGRR
jgi:pimeloyl-ACP methyl ester carboxylesterase